MAKAEPTKNYDNTRILKILLTAKIFSLFLDFFLDQIYYRHKNGYQASLGEFVGRSCRVAPLRNTLREAIKDCFEFMEAHNDKRLLKIRLDEQYFAQNLATSIFESITFSFSTILYQV